MSAVSLSGKEENISSQASLSIGQSDLCYRNVTSAVPNSGRKRLCLVFKRRISAEQSSRHKVKNLGGKRPVKEGRGSES